MRGKAGFLRLRRLTTVGVRCGTAIAVAVEEQAQFITWALAGAWMARRSAVQRGLHWLDRVAGALFIGFGIRLALADAPAAR